MRKTFMLFFYFFGSQAQAHFWARDFVMLETNFKTTLAPKHISLCIAELENFELRLP